MAWVIPDERCCPSCGYKDRILVMKANDPGYRLSCGWCAYLSERFGAQEVFFKMWGSPGYKPGAIMDLEGVPHFYKGRHIESVPIRVINNTHSALVVERKEDAA